MGLFSRRDRGTIVASAARIEPREPKKPEDPTTKHEEWQRRAYDMRDALPEPRYAERYMGNAFSRMRIYPGIIPAVGEDPVELDPNGDRELGYGSEEAMVALDLVDRLRSPQGGIREIQRRIGAHLTIAGECLLCGRPSQDPGFAGTERWDIYSAEELVKTEEGVGDKPSQWVLKPPHGYGGTTVELERGKVVVMRIMLPHPRFSAWADSPMRAGLGILEELLTLTKAIQAVAYSRISGAGLLLLPKSMLQAQTSERESDHDGQAVVKYPLAQEMIDVMAAAKADPGNPAAQVPVLAWVPDEIYEQIGSDKLFQWSHDLDTIMAAQREELIRRFAIAIDLPADILTGKADLNHWNAASVDDEAFRMHIEPLVILAVGGLTAGYFLPGLRKAAVPMPERFGLWYDPSELVVRPNRATDAKDAHERFLISDAKARADLGYTDEDAPEDDEVARRIQIERARKAPAAALNGDGPPPGAEEAQPSPNGTQADANGTQFTLTAAASDATAEAIGEIARTLLRDLQMEADALMRRGLERANARVRTLAGRRGGDTFARDAVKGITADSLQVVPTLGPTIVHALANDEDLLAGAFDRLHAIWDERVARADDALQDLMGGDDEVTRQELAEARELGWAALLAALTARAGALLFQPDALAPEMGEFDGLLVQPGDVREALIVAGGGGAEATDLTSGEIVERGFRREGKRMEGKRWRYGDPSLRRHPFEPHEELDKPGRVYQGPSDPRLRNTSGWPPVEFYRPGDHKGCLCQLVPARVVSVQRGPVGSPDEIVPAGVG